MWRSRTDRRGDPWHELAGFVQQFDRMFDEIQGSSARSTAGGPAAQVEDSPEAYLIQLDVPGFAEADLTIDATPEGVLVRGERKLEAPDGFKPVRRERSTQRFTRSFSFPTRVELDEASATLERGVLSLKLWKRSQDRPRRIAVKSA